MNQLQFDSHEVDFEDCGFINSLIISYLNHNPEVERYVHRMGSKEDYYHQMQERGAEFGSRKRKTLVDALRRQNACLKEFTGYDEVENNLEILGMPNTFTVTTGHQLCLFSGPLYFIYKILSTIKLSRELKHQFPDKQFVPMLWLASEDHDWEEVNHFYFGGKKYVWNKDVAGAVGRQDLVGINELLQKYKEDIFPKSAAAMEWIAMLEEAYLQSENLAEATRKLCHRLFGSYGLLILDADDEALKRSFSPIIEREIFERNTYKKVNELSENLGRMWFKQVNPREINLFYMLENLRERIVYEDSKYLVLNTDISFSEEELHVELGNHPERFSPNVVTRPIYQEFILPNLAYVGGAGELAYWMQYKLAFEMYGMKLPILVLRNSVALLPAKVEAKWQKAGFEVSELFGDSNELFKKWMAKNRPIDPTLSAQEELLKQIFDEIDLIAAQTDKSMEGAAKAQRAKQTKGLLNLKKKLLRAEKRKNSELNDLLTEVKNLLYPNGTLQERHENISEYLVSYGPGMLDYLLDQFETPTRKAIVIFHK